VKATRSRWRFFFVLLLASCGMIGNPTPASCPPFPATVRFGNAALTVDVATDEAGREHGLMGVSSLPPNHGMLFVWDAPTDGSFWMKDTLIPLSIAFVGQDGKIVTIQEMTPCAADPCPTYAANAPYIWAVEANAGWFDQHGIEIGDQAEWERHACS
jgi:uncharacterized membrane protein (UPF0127 family)